MLSKLRIQRYKSLFDTEVDLEPLTVFIGPNGSGKSNLCEALAVLSGVVSNLTDVSEIKSVDVNGLIEKSLQVRSRKQQPIQSKFWHGESEFLSFTICADSEIGQNSSTLPLCVSLRLNASVQNIQADHFIDGDPNNKNRNRPVLSWAGQRTYLSRMLKKVAVYDFSPASLASNRPLTNFEDMQEISGMGITGEGLAYELVDILHANRQSFDELEQRLTELVPNIQKIALPRGENRTFSLELVDRYSNHHIPAADISDGTLRILAFLTALYQENTPSILCFEELENGVHPWLLHKMVELLKTISTQGITGQPVQVLITTHSPVLLNYVEPHQVRAVELDEEGKTQVHALPVDSVRFQKAMAAYDGALGELWFTNIFGGNPV